MLPTKVLSQFEVDAVIVDLDGTMVDTLGDFCAALNLMLADLQPPYRNHQMQRATVERLVGKGSEHLIKSVLSLIASNCDATQLTAEKQELVYVEAWTSYQRHYLAINGQYADVYPGVFSGLTGLKSSGVRLVCLTNKPMAFAKTLLQLKGLDHFFEMVFGGDSFELKKPDPLPLIKTCEALGTPAHRTLMIGDSSNDALAARAAGCPVLLVTYGYNHGQPIRQVNADAFTDSLATLI